MPSNEIVKNISSTVLPKSKLHCHPEKFYECEICGEHFNRASSLGIHMKSHECHICGMSFGLYRTLKIHLTVHTAKKTHKCEICRKRFIRKVALKTHMQKHIKRKQKRQKKVREVSVEMNTVSSGVLPTNQSSRTLETRNDNKPYQCNICKFSFDYFVDLKTHCVINGHLLCKEMFTMASSSRNDVSSSKHGNPSVGIPPVNAAENSSKMLPQKIVKKEDKLNFENPFLFMTPEENNLENFIKPLIGKVRRYACLICGKTAKRMSTMKMHIMVHSHKKPHKCDICGKSFGLIQNLNRHTLTHSNQEELRCDVCKKDFTQRKDLTDHIREYHRFSGHINKPGDTQQFETKQADESSNFKVAPKQNPVIIKEEIPEFTELNEASGLELTCNGKPYECDVCGETFTLAASLHLHTLLHNNNHIYICRVCGKTFLQMCDLKQHSILHHSNRKS
uniref:zinc finger protein 728-like n=1 Tax=Styela clava TaxID=7725 RepID=UPI00193A0F3C|nr:zinc finger protein 728-like [Styela clava]